jgi:uncharacterized membrane protein
MGTHGARAIVMYTKARIAGHPIHAMLVALPIGAFVLTVGALLGYMGTNDLFYYRAAMVSNIAGVVSAVFAAIFGAIDLLSLPPSQARTTGFRHASFALLTVGFFAASAGLLWHGWNSRLMVYGAYELDASFPLALQLMGLLTLVIVGSLGWELVHTHHVGVKPTFARADHTPSKGYFDDLTMPVHAPPGDQGDLHSLRHYR